MIDTLEAVDLCLPGLCCPMPVLRAKKTLAKMAGGTFLRVVSTDRHSLADLAEFCRQTGHELVSQSVDETANEYITVIKRRLD